MVQIVEASGPSNVEWTESLAIGSSVAGEVQEIKDYGVIINMPSHNDVVGFVTHYQCTILLTPVFSLIRLVLFDIGGQLY